MYESDTSLVYALSKIALTFKVIIHCLYVKLFMIWDKNVKNNLYKKQTYGPDTKLLTDGQTDGQTYRRTYKRTDDADHKIVRPFVRIKSNI